MHSNGEGVTETSAVLYSIDASVAKKDKESTRKKAAGEPKERFNVRFYLDQSFLKTQEKDDIQMWHAEPSFINCVDGQ